MKGLEQPTVREWNEIINSIWSLQYLPDCREKIEDLKKLSAILLSVKLGTPIPLLHFKKEK